MKLTREQMVADILGAMDNWDIDTLISWAKDARSDMLAKCSDEEIKETYISDCNEDQELDEDNEENDNEGKVSQ